MLIDAFSLHFPSAFLLWLEDSGAKTYLEGLAGWNSILKASQYLGLVKSLPASQYLCLMIRLLQILPVWTCLLVLVLRLLFNGLGMWRALRDSWKLQRVVMEMLSVSFSLGNKGVLAEFTSLGYVGHMREMLWNFSRGLQLEGLAVPSMCFGLGSSSGKRRQFPVGSLANSWVYRSWSCW